MAKYDDFRIIFKSDQIVNSPMAYLTDMPADLKKAIRDAVLDIATKDKAAFDKIYRRQAAAASLRSTTRPMSRSSS